MAAGGLGGKVGLGKMTRCEPRLAPFAWPGRHKVLARASVSVISPRRLCSGQCSWLRGATYDPCSRRRLRRAG